nr:MAG TPA: hypothetical protein [Caudoviricetes sp.]
MLMFPYYYYLCVINSVQKYALCIKQARKI